MRKQEVCLEDLELSPHLFFFGKQLYTILDTACSCIHCIIYYQLKYNILHSFIKNLFACFCQLRLSLTAFKVLSLFLNHFQDGSPHKIRPF